MIRTLAVLSCLLALSAPLFAESTPPADNAKLGQRFSGMFDISFQPFPDAKVDKQGAGIIRYVRDDKNWQLSFDKADLPTDIQIADVKDIRGVVQEGYLTANVNKIRSSDQTAEVLKNEVLDMGNLRQGMIVATMARRMAPAKAGDAPVVTKERVLMQMALIEITPRTYFSLVMTSPAPEKDVEQDAGVQEAAGMFKEIVESIRMVDLSSVREDQEQRLFRTRGLFVSWNEKMLLSKLTPERILRFVRDGKDVGYAYIVEQPARGLPRMGQVEKEAAASKDESPGFRVGMRMRTMVPATPATAKEPAELEKIVDVESWMFVSFNRKHEIWSNASVIHRPAAKTEKEREVWFTEVGASDLSQEREFNQELKPEDYADMDKRNKEIEKRNKLRKQGEAMEEPFAPYRIVDKYRMIVRTESRSAVDTPFQRELPPFYLPQALGAMLPRLLPLSTPNSYLFATYNSDSRQVMLRYVDVGTEGNVTIDGKSQRAIPVTEKLGTDGPPTIHYLTLKGQYLGTQNPQAKLWILPTDRETLTAIWKDANLSAPSDLKKQATNDKKD